jgi:hypothetical protein
VQFPDYGTVLWSPGSRNISRKHCDFSTYLANRAGAHSVACAEVQFPVYGTVLWSPGSRIFPGNTSILAHILPRERELCLAHAQRSSFLITEEYCGPLAVEMIPGKHCEFSTYLTKRARTHSGAWTDVKFPDYGTVLWSPGSRDFARKAAKHCDFSTYLTKRARALFGASAVVQFPDYGTVQWPPGSRNVSRKTLRFQHLSSQDGLS